jgi:hypothetical protein
VVFELLFAGRIVVGRENRGAKSGEEQDQGDFNEPHGGEGSQVGGGELQGGVDCRVGREQAKTPPK